MTSLFIYNSILLSPIFLLFFKGNKYKKIVPFILIILCCYVSFLSAIRLNVGTDYVEYLNIYNDIEYNGRFEFGFVFLIRILKYFGFGSSSLFFVTSFMIYGVIFYVYRKKQSVIFLITWMLLFYFLSLNQIRQAVSMAFLLLSIFFLIDKKYIKYFLSIFFSISFHNVGILGIVFLFLVKFNFKKIHLIALLCPLFVFISIPHLLNKLDVGYLEYYNFYLTHKKYSGGQSLSIGGVIRLIIPYLFLFTFRDRDSRYFNLIKNSMFIYISFYFLSLNFYILYRVYLLFMLFIPFAADSLLGKNKKSKYICFLIVLLLWMVAQKNILTNTINPRSGQSIYPYQTIFTEKPVYPN